MLQDGEGKPGRERVLRTLSATRPEKAMESRDIRSEGGWTLKTFFSPESNSRMIFVGRAGWGFKGEFKFSSRPPVAAVILAEMMK